MAERALADIFLSVISATSKEFSQKTIFARQAGIQTKNKSDGQRNANSLL
ncbi:MAG: hypothetical protein LBP40_08735 [Campylobacteraceae bacterium]|jgi:hypothetical protein|nr:hypothetical protein [Campylobacteraceae bacterium]